MDFVLRDGVETEARIYIYLQKVGSLRVKMVKDKGTPSILKLPSHNFPEWLHALKLRDESTVV